MSDLDDEIQSHLEHEIDCNVARGMSLEQARAAALRKFGSRLRVKEEVGLEIKPDFTLNLPGWDSPGPTLRRADDAQGLGLHHCRDRIAGARPRRQRGFVQPDQPAAAAVAPGSRTKPAGRAGGGAPGVYRERVQLP